MVYPDCSVYEGEFFNRDDVCDGQGMVIYADSNV